MATTLYILSPSTLALVSGNNDANLRGTATGWSYGTLGTARGGGLVASAATATVAGPTSGVEAVIGTLPGVWISQPLAADVTISGSITWNIWAAESSNSANVAINGVIEKVDGATGAFAVIDTTVRTTEVALTTRAVNNFAKTPAAGVLCKKGDRLRVRIFGDDAGTMGTGFTFTIGFGLGSAGADGDTFLTLTENLTFASEPAGTQVFLTDTASDVSTASVDREAWTSRGAGVQTDVTNTVAGWTAPIQITDTAGGTVVDWFTRPLTAFTIGGAVRCNVYLATSPTSKAHVRIEVARVAGDGTSPTVWASGETSGDIIGASPSYSWLIAGADLAVSDGQRLRIRLYIDDSAAGPMLVSAAITLSYAGTSGGASGDTFLTFTQSLTEFVPPVVPYVNPYPPLLAQ